MLPPTDQALVDAVLGAPGPAQRRALARTITLLESTRADHRERAEAVLAALLPASARSLRVGISGVPGVGKSTFIEALGLQLIAAGHRVAVLAVDPSSSVSGGSILGDKTRMERLSADERAYIRPSPASGTLGGVAQMTREAMLVCEAAGHDIVIVETVGVGQSETAVAAMTDVFVLMQLPNAGDDLQAIKKGVMELADLVVINKADLDAAAATRARAHITGALRLLGLHGDPQRPHGEAMASQFPAPDTGAPDTRARDPRSGDPKSHDAAAWRPPVLETSALRAEGMVPFWQAVLRFRDLQTASGRFAQRRQQQTVAWLWERIDAGLQQRFRAHPAVQAALPGMTEAVRAGHVPASVAARRLLDQFH
jgi:LAO/AO transport system kinase